MERTLRSGSRSRPPRRRRSAAFDLALALALAIAFAVGMAACAQHRPVLYPNAQYDRVGPAGAQADIEDCMQRANAYVGNVNPAAETAKSTGIGAAIGGAIGAVVGAIRGHPGTDAAVGAAAGGTGGLARGVLGSRRNDPVFQRFVDRCLTDRGYEPIGWR